MSKSGLLSMFYIITGPLLAGDSWMDEYMRARERFVATGDSSAAIEALKHLISEAEPFGGNDLRLAISIGGLGSAYSAAGAYDKAESNLKRAAAIFESHAPKADKLLAQALSNLMFMYFDSGQLYKAESTSSRLAPLIDRLPSSEEAEGLYS